MNDQTHNIPKIRFPGYTDPWEQRKLSDEFSDFIVPMRDKPKEFGGTVPWTRIEDIEGKYLNGTLSGQYVTEETIKKMNLKIIPKDSLIVSSSATFGVVAIVTQDLITNQTFIGLVPKDKSIIDFWYSYFQSNEARRYMKLQSAGSTIFYISRESFEKMPITVPSKDEAAKIGEFFTNLDNTITLHQRKLDQAKEYKKGMLHKLFPKIGSNVPEVRFPGFTAPWEQRKLAEMSEFITKGATPTTYGFHWVDEGVPFFRNDAIKDNQFVYGDFSYISEEANEALSRSEITGDDILIAITGDIGKVGIVPKSIKKANINQHTARVRIIDNAVPYFVYQSLASEEQQKIYQKIKTGLSMPQLSLEQIRETTILCPSIEEQTKIADILLNLDKTTTLLQRKIDQIKEYKKGLLRQMFI